MTFDPDSFILDEWVPALRSGDYRQGYGTLKDATGAYCCLGLGAKILADTHPEVLDQLNLSVQDRDGGQWAAGNPDDGLRIYDEYGLSSPNDWPSCLNVRVFDGLDIGGDIDDYPGIPSGNPARVESKLIELNDGREVFDNPDDADNDTPRVVGRHSFTDIADVLEAAALKRRASTAQRQARHPEAA